MTVREVPNGGGVCLAGAQEREVASYTEMAEVLEKGTLFRATAATNMNAKSSRSHAIFTITLEQRKRPVMRADAPVTEGEEVCPFGLHPVCTHFPITCSYVTLMP